MKILSKMILFIYSILLLTIQIDQATSAAVGMANFTNANDSGVTGTVTLHRNPVFGSFLVGQLQNISCQTGTSATTNPVPNPIPLANNCMLGMTVNNWRTVNGTIGLLRADDLPELQFLQTIFNLSNIRFPTIQGIINGNYNPLPNLFPLPTATTTPAPINTSQLSNRQCSNVGDLYNPRRGSYSSPFGLWSAPGILGNMPVVNGTGSLLMGPLEYLTAGPTSVVGLPLVLWMNALTPAINGSAVTVNPGSNDKILACAPIMPIEQSTSS